MGAGAKPARVPAKQQCVTMIYGKLKADIPEYTVY